MKTISNLKMTKNMLRVIYEVLESSLNGVLITNEQNQVLYVNSSFLKIFGADKLSLIGKKADSLFGRNKIKNLEDVGKAVASSGKEHITLAIKTKKGETTSVEVTVSEMVDTAGEIIGRMASFIDISEYYELKKRLGDAKSRIRELSSKLVMNEENQRKAIVRELHDGVGSNLTAIKLALESKRKRDRSTDPDEPAMEILISIVQETIEDIQRICKNVRPSLLDKLGLIFALNSLCRDYQSLHNDIEIMTFFNLHEEDVPESLKIVIYRILQEALNNVFKHSHATRIYLSLKNTHENIELFISDDGIGFDYTTGVNTKSPEEKLGLSHIEERTKLYGGQIKISSEKGKGTIISAKWPKKLI